MPLYVATTNPGKLRDFAYGAAQPLSSSEINPDAAERLSIEPLPGVKHISPPPEDEPTFEANAREKAIYYSLRAPGLLVLADDSGLEVTCLDNAPGVRSARYADDRKFPSAPGSTPDERNNAALLRALDGVPELCRQARYRCALALACDGQILASAEGMLEGAILTAPRGDGGFGYDPLFFLGELGQTMAEIDPPARLVVSHRGRALRNLFRDHPERFSGLR